MSKKFPIGIIFTVSVVWVTSFLSWGSASTIGLLGETVTFPISAWTSSISLGELVLPNWLLFSVATFIGGLKVLESLFSSYTCARWVVVSLSVYGLLHISIFFLLVSFRMTGGTIGAGLLFTLVSYIALVVMTARKEKLKEQVVDDTTQEGAE